MRIPIGYLLSLVVAKESAFEKDKVNIIKQLDSYNYESELKISKNLLVEFFAPWEIVTSPLLRTSAKQFWIILWFTI